MNYVDFHIFYVDDYDLVGKNTGPETHCGVIPPHFLLVYLSKL